jgi:nitronate monooxygenase
MGGGVSNRRLAQAVSRLGQLGVVSLTALDQVFVSPSRRRRSGRPHGALGEIGDADAVSVAVERLTAGVQLGAAFAFSRESRPSRDLKRRLLSPAAAGTGHVFTNPLASPTGYPFKIAQLESSLSDATV